MQRPIPNKKTPLKKKRRPHDPFTIGFSMILGAVVILLLFILIKKLQAYHTLKNGDLVLNEMNQRLNDQLSKDLFAAGLYRGACWQPPFSVDARGEQLKIIASEPNFVTALKIPATGGSKGIQVTDISLIRQGMLLRICSENFSELLTVDKTAFLELKKSESKENPKKREGRFTFTRFRGGDVHLLLNSYPAGALLTNVQEVSYLFNGGEIIRKSSLSNEQILATAKSFKVEISTNSSSNKLQLNYQLFNRASGIARPYRFSWLPWYSGPAMTSDQMSSFYDHH